MNTEIISFCNQKGGVGKTSTTALVAYNLSKMGYKTLVLDCDPQANMTSLMLKTKSQHSSDIEVINDTLMNAIKNDENLLNIVINISVGATTPPMSPQLPQILIHASIVLEIALTDKLLAHEFIKGY